MASDVGNALYGRVSGLSHVYDKLDPKQTAKVKPFHLGRTDGGRDQVIITESGLYHLILRCNKPSAKPFQDWITRVVLPTIRKTGGYVVGVEKAN